MPIQHTRRFVAGLLLILASTTALADDVMRSDFAVWRGYGYFLGSLRPGALELFGAAGTGTWLAANLGSDGRGRILPMQDSLAIFIERNDRLSLWRYDRTTATEVHDLGEVELAMATSDATRVMFTTSTHALWISDATDAGTTKILDLPAAIQTHVLTNELLFFVMDGALWRSDGTLAGTFSLQKPATGLLTRIGESDVLFESNDGVWRSDGTPGGFTLIAAVDASDILGIDNFAYIATRANLMRTDGTAAGTRVVVTPTFEPAITQLLRLGPGSPNLFFVQANRWRYFNVQSGLWSDVGAFATPLAVFNGEWIYTGNWATGELWAKRNGAYSNVRISQTLSSGYRFVPLYFDGPLLFVSGREGNTEPWAVDPIRGRATPLLRPITRLTGRVVDGFTLQPIVNAEVFATSTNGTHYEAALDASGRFDFEVVPGEYTLAARSRDNNYLHTTMPESVVVPDFTTVSVTVPTFRGGTISGRVVDSNGAPIADHPILIGDRSTWSRADGMWESPLFLPTGRPHFISALQSSEHSRVIYDGIECWNTCSYTNAKAVTAQPNTRVTNVDFVLKPTGIVRGRLFDLITGAQIVDHFTVVARGPNGARHAATNENGVFSVKIPDGGARLEAIVSGPYRITYGSVEYVVPPGTIVENADLQIEPIGAIVRGRAIDVDSGQPVPNVSLLFESMNGGVPVTKATTADDGSFTTGGWFQPGRYRVRPQTGAWQFQPGAEIVIPSLHTVQADVLLTRTAIVTGIVRDRVTRQPLRDATVTITNASTNETFTRTTDFTGRFTAELVRGSYAVRAEKAGWRFDMHEGGAAFAVAPGATLETEARLAPQCSTEMTPHQTKIDAQGGTGQLKLSSSCSVCAFSSSPFITLPQSCATAGTITYTVARNRGPARTGWILVPGGKLRVEQRSAP